MAGGARIVTVRVDAVVIGAGIIGASVALELARSGRSVVCVDRGPAPGAGSTSASSALIRFSYSTPDAVLTAWESAPHWERWSEHLGTVDPNGMVSFVRTGMLIFDAPSGTMPRVTALWDEIGVPYERLHTDALAARYPGLDLGSYFPPKPIDDPAFADDSTSNLSAVFDPNAGYVDDPLLAAHNVAFAARAHGAEILLRRRVVEVLFRERRVSGVRLDDDSVLEAPVVVNAAGPHSAALNRLAGADRDMRIGHRALRQEVFTAPAPATLVPTAELPIVVDLDLGQYFRGQPGDLLLVGGTEPECDPMEWIDDADRFDEHCTVARFETTMLRLARRVPDFGVPIRPTGLAALYDVADDWVPIYDASCVPGWFMACATSGNQFKNAPLAGKFMVSIIESVERGASHDEDPVQFPGARTGRHINLGAFSRLRNPTLTSGTVMG